MSGCKINQNMEFGDIIYFILLVFFLILGFFNDSRKKKRQQMAEAQKQPETAQHPENEFSPFLEEEEDIEPYFEEGRGFSPPPAPPSYSAKERYNHFQSSLDLVSIHEEPSTLSSYTFDYDVNSFYEVDADSPDAPANAREDKSRKFQHPLIQSLRGETRREELMKGLIYGEIMQRKY